MEKNGTQERKGEEEALGKEIYIKCLGTRTTETKGGSTRRSRSSGDQELGVRGQGVVYKESPIKGSSTKSLGCKEGWTRSSSAKTLWTRSRRQGGDRHSKPGAS